MTLKKEEIKYLKQDLEDLQLYLDEFSNFLPLPVVSANPLNFVLYINKAFENLVGSSETKILGTSVDKFFPEKKKLAEAQKKMLKGEKVEGKEMILLAKKKKKISVNVYFAPRKDKEGNIIGYFIGLFDITDFKKLQKTLEKKVKQRTKELQERIDELEKFHKLAVGRELKMIELKEEIKKLKGRR